MAAELEARAREFLAKVMGGPKPDQTLQEYLKDGTVLCNMLNKLIPGTPIKKINTSALPFKQIENISTYLSTCTKVGKIPEAAQFDTTDLFEDKGMLKVLQHLDYVQRHESELNSIDPNAVSSAGSSAEKKGVPQPSISMRKIPTPRPSANDIGGVAPTVSSLESDIETKEEMKFNPELERMARNWISNVLKNDPSVSLIQANKPLVESLKSGVLLCKLINAVVPGTIPKIHNSNIAYQQIENVRSYLIACGKIGLSSLSVFDVPDLYDNKNVSLVIQNIHTLAKHVKAKITDYKGPQMEEEDISKTKSLFSSSLVETQLKFLSEENEEDEPTEPEEKELVAWVNAQLAKSDTKDKSGNPLKIKNLGSSLKSGVKLIELLKVLTQSTHVGSYVKEPATLWDCMRNAKQALKFLSYQTLEGFQGCNARDIVGGNVSSITNLLEYLREKFDVDFLFQQIVNNISVDSKNAPASLSSSDLIETLKGKEERDREKKEAKRKKREARDREKRENEQKKMMDEQKKRLEEQEAQLEKMRMEKKKRDEEIAKKDAEHKKKVEEREKRKNEEEASRKALEEKQKQIEQQRKVQQKEHESKLKEEARKIEEQQLQLKKQIQEREEAELKAKQEREAREEEERKLAKKLQDEEKRLAEEKKRLEEEKKRIEEEKRLKEIAEKKREEEEKKEALKRQEEAKKAAQASPPTEVKQSVNSETARVQAARYVVRKKIATEMLTTEQSYLKNLNLIKSLVEKIRSQKILDSDTLFKVFANAEELGTQHTLFLQDLEGALKNWKDENSTIGSIVMKHASLFLPLYRPYIHNFNSSFATVHYLRKKNPQFLKAVNAFENENSMMDSFLILPVQRIPRYILLLRDLMKYTDDSHPDAPLLKQASNFLDEGLKNINSSIDNSIMENTTKMIEIENLIDGLNGEHETLLAPGRKFIREGRLNLKLEKDKKAAAKIKGKSPFANFKKSESNPYFALFSDILVYCEGKKDSQKMANARASKMVDGEEKLFDFRGVVPISSVCKVELLKTNDKKKANGVVVNTNHEVSESFYLFGQTPQEQTVWLNDLILALLASEKERMRK